MIWLLALLATGGGVVQDAPSDASVIYYNARLALREHRPYDTTRLWLLRNAYEDQTGRVSPHDADFNSVTWAALGEQGICQDGLRRDKDGAGLWPLALHNYVVRTRTRRAVSDRPNPFQTFEVERQQRFVAIDDVLDREELRTVSFLRGRCLGPVIALVEAGESPLARLKDRQVATRLLRYLLERAKLTLDPLVRGQAAIDARLFDVHLQLIQLSRIEAQRQAREQSRLGRALGLGRPSVQAMRDDAPGFNFPQDSVPANILRQAARWDVDAWTSLSPDRRLYLFDQAKAFVGGPTFDSRALELLDAAIDGGDGGQATAWIARYDGDRAAVWSGERGQRLLALDAADGFDERAVIALHRGVDLLQRGELDASLRALAYAVKYAPESGAGSDVHGLALRWLSYLCSRFEITDGLLVTLQELVPVRDYSTLLEGLMWSAAFRADGTSFERGLANQVGRGALGRRLGLLAPLAQGDATAFSRTIEAGLTDSPSETLRFLDQLVQRLELEESSVRALQRPTLGRVRALLEPLADPTADARQARRAAALLRRTLAILEGLGGAGPDSDRDQARVLAPGSEVFAGSVRLAPSDALPWPFSPAEVAPPSAFTPLEIRPVEWRNLDDEVYLGWSLGG